ncbi:MAG: GNAT family N-acetyltransferase [Desulfobacteraceae bacterium]|nr:GNAT family N-acetyltransferase [Desulfobacteraceae bacterium]
MNSKKISLRPIKDGDVEFLYRVYAGTRQAEMAVTGWEERQIDAFLRMQFQLQHKQYMANHARADLNIIRCGHDDVGRLYVLRSDEEISIMDIALLPEHQRMGIGTQLLNDLTRESALKNLPITLNVEYNNPAIYLYEKMGFKAGELNGIHYPMLRQP